MNPNKPISNKQSTSVTGKDMLEHSKKYTTFVIFMWIVNVTISEL